MDFFDAQDDARRTSKWLIVVFIPLVAVFVALIALIIAPAFFYIVVGIAGMFSGEFELRMLGDIEFQREFFILAAVLTTSIILIASVFKRSMLSAGGGVIAIAQGGTLLEAIDTDPLVCRLRNVVEEMAIASGVPVPEIYVLEREGSINAFAAGFTPSDAAIAVTRGALDSLSRTELQGVIAHEFSHILNGDMRLYMRLLGLLYGITFVALIGRTIMRAHVGLGVGIARSSPRLLAKAALEGAMEGPKGCAVALIVAPLILILSLMAVTALAVVSGGFALIGFIGQLFGRALKAAVSRQREYLADASSVQFTRQTEGIVGALIKIGGHRKAPYAMAVDAEEVSHMLFSRGSAAFAGIATHPPLIDRIQALDPTFNEADYPDFSATGEPQIISDEEFAAKLAAHFAAPPSSLPAPVVPMSIAASVGQPEPAHVEYAKRLRESIPEDLYAAAHSVGQSPLLTLALLLDRSGQHIERQMILAEDHMGTELSGLLRNLQERLMRVGLEYRLPLLELAFPALKRRPATELVDLVEFADRLVKSDGEVDLFEFCFYRILRLNLVQALNPAGSGAQRGASGGAVGRAVVNMITIVAQNGHEDPAEAQAALDIGKALLGEWAASADIDAQQEISVDTLDESLELLLGLNYKSRRKLLLAVCETAGHDGQLDVAEGELIRVVCATLDCPLPPILVDDSFV